MENEVLKKLKVLIEALTHSGCNTLNEDIFKEVKMICKSSQENIPHVYNLVLKELKRKNSQIRLAAFQICKELFKRSGLFREHVLRDLNLIFDLTLESNSKKLPPPKSSAESLKCLAISTLKLWVNEFGETHKKLKIAYQYFEKCRLVDFETFQVRNSAEQAVENEKQRHLKLVNEEKIKKVLEEFKSNESEIEITITSLSNCLSLLLPPAEDFFIPEHELEKISVNDSADNSNHDNKNSKNSQNVIEDENEENGNSILQNKGDLRECGISLDYNLPLKLDFGNKFKIVKTEENSSIIENAKDCIRLIQNRFLPMVKKWIKVYCKCSEGNSTNIKKIIDLKEKLESIIKKFNLLFIDENFSFNNDETDSDNDEFEEVKKEGYEEGVDFSEENMLDCFKSNCDDKNSLQAVASTSKDFFENKSEMDSATPSTSGNESNPSNPSKDLSKSTSPVLDRKKKLLLMAPKLPYDIDLYHWEDEKLSTPTLISTKIDVDKFWGSNGSDDLHEIPNPEGVAALRTRVIEFAGTFEPVKWACRAPLPNGKLCPRKDRFKCPFHGKIVPRDETGNMINKDDHKTVDIDKKQPATVHDFQDSEFMRDLQAATGLDLTIPKKGKRRKTEKKNLTHKKMKTSTGALKILESKNLPGLVDVVKRQNNAYTRLSKKIFNRSSLRRVSAVLNKLDKNKFRDKFGDQFNYL